MDWKKMTDAQFDEARKADPGAAIRCALDRLTDAQFDEARKAAPWPAIVYAKDRLKKLGLA